MKYQIVKTTDDDDAVLATFVTYEDALLRIATIGKESRGFLRSWSFESDSWEQVDPTTGKVLFALVIQAVSTRDALVAAAFQRVLREHAEVFDALAENDGPVR